MANEALELLPKTGKVPETRESSNDRDNKSRKRVGKRHKPSPVKRLWNWATSLFDAKPYEVRESWGTTTWHLSKRLLTLSILVGAITLGIIQQSFDISKRSIAQTFQVNEDAQLAVFGLLNTLLALMVRDSLGHIADTVVTTWMVSSGRGASPLDFEMYEESVKPWVAVSNVHARRKHHGWRIRDGARFAVCAVTGVCLLLQGASMNTIGMPKLRWWPDTRFVELDGNDDRLFFKTKMVRVASVSYMSVWERSFQTIKQGGGVSWEVAHAIGAMSTFGALETIHDTFSQPPGWTFASKQDALIRNAMNVTATSTPSIQAMSIHGSAIVDMWDEQRKTSKYAGIRRSHGWEAKLNLNGILFDTECHETSQHPVGSWKSTDYGNGTFSIQLGPAALNEPFRGATCSVTISQALIGTTQWIVRDGLDRDRPGYSIDEYGKNRYPAIHPLPGSAGDIDIAKQLSDWFNAVLPNVQSLSSRQDVSNFTSLVVRLADVIVELDRGHGTLDGLSVVLSTILSNFLTTFSWTFEEVSGETTKQGPVRWQIYGSGPRLPWQWVSAAVIAVSIVVQLVDIFYILLHRKMKGHWLSLGGMLVAANAAKKMVADDQGAGFLTEEDKFVRYHLRCRVDDNEPAKATLVDDEGLKEEDAGYGKLKEGERYGDVGRRTGS